MNIFSFFSDALPWLFGGGLVTIAAIVALWFIAPTAIPIIGSIIKPVAEVAGNLLGNIGRAVSDAVSFAINDIFDDGRTILVVVAALFIVSSFYSWKYEDQGKPTFESCKPVIDQLRKEYKFIER